MDAIGPGRDGGADHAADVQIALRRGRRADMKRFVRGLDVESVRIGIRIDGNGTQTEPPRGADNAGGDLAAVGDQDLLEHAAVIARASGGCSASSQPPQWKFSYPHQPSRARPPRRPRAGPPVTRRPTTGR